MQRHRKHVTHSEDLKKSTETDPEMTPMIKLEGKGIKRVTMIIFHMFKKHEERLNIQKEIYRIF